MTAVAGCKQVESRTAPGLFESNTDLLGPSALGTVLQAAPCQQALLIIEWLGQKSRTTAAGIPTLRVSAYVCIEAEQSQSKGNAVRKSLPAD